jgi:iron complex transport system permease protein
MKHLPNHKLWAAYLAAALLLLAALIAGVLCGAGRISLAEALRAICTGNTQSTDGRILLYVRLPRVLGALLCGGALAASGAVIQGVLANRLASPSIVGVNAGAGLAVTISAAFGVTLGWRVSLFAFLGAAFAVMLVSLGARHFGASRGTVILMGVALNALFGAVSDTITALFPAVAVSNVDFKVGSFASVTYVKLIPVAIVILVGTAILFTLSNELDVLSLGDENAKGLGLRTDVMRVVFLLLAAMLAGASVSVAGLVSFVGLLVPHGVRRLSGGRHLLPLCFLYGGALVSFSDTLARIVAAPYELPVGIITAFLGAPVFLFILIKGKGGHTHA